MKKDKPFRELPNYSLKKNYLIMRIATFLLIIGALQTYAVDTYSQKTRLSLDFLDTELIKVLDNIEVESEFYFLYNEKLLDTERKVSISGNDLPINSILDNLFAGTDIKYSIIDRKIILAPDYLADDKATAVVLQQQQIITGKVTDSQTGDAMPGVNILVVGTSIGVITDASGRYSISVTDRNATLRFSFIGYVTQEVPLNGRSTVDVYLISEVTGLDEVVVIGYGTAKKIDLTGTISTVRTEKTMDIPNTNVLQALSGSVAGLNITTPYSAGQSPSVDIRGVNSISISNTPLIVVDGIIYNGSLNDFDVTDIEKVDVLKDASAASVYGSRSSNGVIIITTKTGKATKPTFNLKTQWGITNPVYLIPVLDGPGYLQKKLDYRTAMGLESDPNDIESYLTATEAQNYRDGKTVNWLDVMFRTGISQNTNLNISGKSDRTNYYFSGTYYEQEGVVVNDNYDRITINANFRNNITNWFALTLKTNFSSSDYSGVAAALNTGISPYGSYWEDESLGIIDFSPFEELYGESLHPLVVTLRDNVDMRTSLLGLVSSELKVPFIEGLKWTLNYAINQRNNKTSDFYDNTLPGTGVTSNGLASKALTENIDWTLDNIINYNRTFREKHAVDITLLYSRESRKYEYTFAQSKDFFSQNLGYNDLGMGVVQTNNSDYQDENSVAFMGRINYIYNNRYLLTATIRRDGFSGFSKDHKYATFPSLAAAWTASEEEFLKNVSWLNHLKFRITYGLNGNQALGRYQTLAKLSNSNYILGNNTVVTAYTSSMANDQLSWETTKTRNFGIDFNIFGNRFYGSIDAYNSITYDVLLKRNIPILTGYSSAWTNIGEVNNKGVEIALNSINLKKNDLIWETGFIFSLNRNRIVKLLGQDSDGDGVEDDDIANQWFIGKPLSVIYSYKINGIYQLDEPNIPTGYKPGDFRIVDTNKDDSITEDDRVILGSGYANYRFSISNTLQYMNFSLYLLFNSIQGGGKDNYYVGDNILMHDVNKRMLTWSERFNLHDVPYWTPDRPSNEYSRITYTAPRTHPYLEDRSFVRLQDVSLSYTFTDAALQKLLLGDLRVYVSGKNLYTWTKWTGYDPENRTTLGGYPMMRTFTLGIDIKF